MILSTPEPASETMDRETLFQRLSSGMTVVSANSRLARVLAGQFSQWRIRRGEKQWQSPGILSWDAWLSELWTAAGLQGVEGAGRAVPGARQLLSLWERVLKDDPHARHLLRPDSLATRLRDTRKLAVEWQLDLHHPGWHGSENENHAAFHHWNRAFEAQCRNDGWIAPEDCSEILANAFRQKRLGFHSGIGLLGFDEFNPAQTGLITALAEAGQSVTRLDMPASNGRAQLWQGISETDELQHMARWVRHHLENEPGSRIAVVATDLQARLRDIERHLAEILVPGDDGPGEHARPWNVSLGRPLAQLPMIDCAFDLLRLLDRRIDIQDAGRVLRSPWFDGGLSERNNRALLEKCLRDNYPRQLKLSEIRYRAGELRKYDRNHEELPPDQHEAKAWNSPLLVSVLDRLMRFERDNRAAREPSAWAEAFQRLLSGLGWPLGSESSMNSSKLEHDENWQAYQAWQDSLRELASLDATTAKLSRTAAINLLQQVCRDRIFQPGTPPANIQVLGLYEISGLRFDHLWVLGLHNGNWPPAAQPNPFIPGQLQQSAGLPQSSPQRELDVARIVTHRLLESAGHCVFSYPGQLDGEKVLPSPLLGHEDIETVEKVPAWEDRNWLATVNAATGPAIDALLGPGPLVKSAARGGSSILKNQALCPFRAFASNRLGAEGLETPADGISPMLHGSLMHRVLEYFWKETQSQENLLALDDASLEERIREQVERVVSDERGLNYRPEFREVEGKRLQRLAAAQLELEKTRSPFRVVGFEREILQEVEGQEIRLIIDRIDRLDSGDEVIIDYKTGRIDPKKWFGDRPEDPQLPLYAISAETLPAAVIFAVIRDDECLYRGVATAEGIFPGLPPRPGRNAGLIIEAGLNMPATIENWRQTLHRLMAEFLAGETAVDPVNGRKTCDGSYCEMQALCRIGELEHLQRMKAPEAAS